MSRRSKTVLVLAAGFAPVGLLALVMAAASWAPEALVVSLILASLGTAIVVAGACAIVLAFGRAKPKEAGGVSRAALAVALVVSLLYLGGAVVIPNLMSGGHRPSNSYMAVSSLRQYLSAQNIFHRTDFYGIVALVYANPEDGTGLPDLYRVGGPDGKGEFLKLIDLAFASATSPENAKSGYYFADITSGPEGAYDHSIDCGLSAMPAQYNRTGRAIFIVDVTGTVYERDAAEVYPDIREGDPVPPVTAYPDLRDWRSLDY